MLLLLTPGAWVVGNAPTWRECEVQEGLCSHLGTSSACHTHGPCSGPTKQGCFSFTFKEPRCREGKRRGLGHGSGLPPGRGAIFTEPCQPSGH